MAYSQFEESAGAFILDTDASNVSIGAVLSQIQDGTERPIAYGSRVLTKAERNYDASDREALALVYFAEYFRHYLLARPFVARMDNTALPALRNLKEPCGRKAHWLDCLSEYELRVVHRPGRQHLNADGLSRLLAEPEAHVHGESPPLAPTPPQDAAPGPPPRDAAPATSSAVTVELDDLSSAALADAQRSDPELSTVWLWYDAASGKFVRPPEDDISGVSRTVKIIWSQIDQLSLRDSVLYILPPFADHDHVGESPRLVVPRSPQERAMIAVHSLPTANHPGVKKTLSQARLRFYWVGIASDITEFVRCCHTCAQIRAKNSTNRAPLQPMIASYPFEIVALDIFGPLPETSQGLKYLLVMANYFTRWVEGFSLRDITAVSFAAAVVNGWISPFGAPEQLHSDQGAQFESRLFADICRLLGIRKTRTTPYHPSGDGLVERVNRTLLGLLRAHITPTSTE